MARPKKSDELDWHAVYLDWRTGTMSNGALARKYGTTTASIGRHVRTEGWTTTNGPAPKVQLTEPAEPTIPKRRADKPDVIKAQTSDQLRKRAKLLAQRLLAEVEDVTTYEGEIGDIIEAEESDVIRRRAAMKAISSGERIKNLKEITAILDAVDGRRKAQIGKPVEIDDEPKGKKAQKQAAAEQVHANRFAPRTGPKLVANNP